MYMKKLFYMIAAAILLVSCQAKTGAALYQGNYSFKTSGSLLLHVEGFVTDIDGNRVDIDEPVDADLATEQGQMDILPMKEDSNEMILTMNILAGSVYTASVVAGDFLGISSFERKVDVNVRGRNISIPVHVTGRADKYEKTLVFDLSYSGAVKSSSDDYELELYIETSDVRCVAKLND